MIAKAYRDKARYLAKASRYKDYYNSVYWKSIEKALLPCSCLLCSKETNRLFHVNSYNAGYEEYKDIIPLCPLCRLKIKTVLKGLYPDLPLYKQLKYINEAWVKFSDIDFNTSVNDEWKDYFICRIDEIVKPKKNKPKHKGKKKKELKTKVKYKKKTVKKQESDLRSRCSNCNRYAPGIALNNKGLCKHCEK